MRCMITLALAMAGCATVQQAADSRIPANAPKLEYWPLSVGDTWTFRDAQNGALSHWTVNAAPSMCGNPQYRIHITKDIPNTYWGTGSDMALDWYIRINPDGSAWSPLAVVFDRVDASGGPLYTFQTDQDVLLPSTFEPVHSVGRYWFTPGESHICDDAAGHSAGDVSWNVAYTLDGDTVTATFREQPVNESAPQGTESWTWQRGKGIVRITTASADGQTRTINRIDFLP